MMSFEGILDRYRRMGLLQNPRPPAVGSLLTSIQLRGGKLHLLSNSTLEGSREMEKTGTH